MKRNIASLLLVIFLLVMSVAPAQAAIMLRDQRIPLAGGFTFLALGDGIAAGSFVDLSAEALKMIPVSYADDGLTSDDLLAMLEDPDDQLLEDMVSTAVVAVSIGGSDLLELVYAIAGEALGMEPSDTSGILDALAGQSVQADALSADEWVGPAVEQFSANWAGIIESIQEINPGATIVALTLYNPFIGVEELAALTPVAEDLRKALNNVIYAGEEDYLIAEVGAFFKNSDAPLTNAAEGSEPFDPLPNADGHALIADLVTELVNTAELIELLN